MSDCILLAIDAPQQTAILLDHLVGGREWQDSLAERLQLKYGQLTE